VFWSDPATLAYSAAAVAFVVLGVLTWRRRALSPVVARALVLAMVGGFWWSVGDAVATGAAGSPLAGVASLGIFPGLCGTVAAFVVLAAAIARAQWSPSRRVVGLLLVEPVLATVAAATNPWHGLFFTGDVADLTDALVWDFGPLFWVHSAYCYLAMAVGMSMVVWSWWKSPRAFKAQRLSVLVAVLVPLIVNAINLAGGLPIDMDPTPVGFAITGMVLVYSIFRQQLFTFAPVARALILEHISDAIVAVSPMGRVIDLNPAGVRLVRRMRAGDDEIIGAPAARLLGAGIAEAGEDGAEVSVELDGAPAELHVRSSRLVDRKGRALGDVYVARDVTEAKAQSRRLEEANAQLTRQVETIERLRADLVEQASRDALTGLHNRRHMVERFDVLLADARAAGTPLTVVLLDVDRFKTINDRHGHLAGDAVLVEVARRLAHAAPPGALVARWGGEEFFVALPGADVVAGLAFAETVRGCLEDEDVDVDGGRVACTLSGGVATFPASGTTTGELFHAADVSLYAAKASGRNQILTGVPARAPAAPSSAGRADALVTPSRGPEGPRPGEGDAH
jgi:diguanylate cyclase (GGDEF)-like protein